MNYSKKLVIIFWFSKSHEIQYIDHKGSVT
jgi:hypothetical protein